MLTSEKKTISIYGVTGSVGKSTVDVIKQLSNNFLVDTVVAKKNILELAKISKSIKPRLAIIEDTRLEKKLKNYLEDEKIEVQSGKQAIIDSSKQKVDIFVAAISGIEGLKSIINCIPFASILAIANKESLVCMGKSIIKDAKKYRCKIIPLDSEHNALFQLLSPKDKSFISKVIITCSGGPFLGYAKKDLKFITPKKALKHPIWSMGDKISIDSATLMNKGLEIIEAVNLFNISESKLDVLIHPQSIIHALVEYIDGTLKACMSVPDMRTPISYALSWPEKNKSGVTGIDLKKVKSLTFDDLNEDTFSAIRISRSVIKLGGNAPTILNAANEEAVGAFLKNKIKFLQIMDLIEEVLSKAEFSQNDSLEHVISSDKNAREMINNLIQRNL